MSLKLPFKLIVTAVLVTGITTGCQPGPVEQVAVKPDATKVDQAVMATKAIAAAKASTNFARTSALSSPTANR